MEDDEGITQIDKGGKRRTMETMRERRETQEDERERTEEEKHDEEKDPD